MQHALMTYPLHTIPEQIIDSNVFDRHRPTACNNASPLSNAKREEKQRIVFTRLEQSTPESLVCQCSFSTTNTPLQVFRNVLWR
jgi:hypothetical protein